MNNPKNYSKLVIILFLILGLSACERSNKEKMLIRRWKVFFDVQEHINSMSAEEKQIYDRLPEELKKQKIKETQKIADQNVFEFKEDNTFEFSLKAQEIEQRGTWQLVEEGGSTKLRISKGKVNPSTQNEIQELTIQELGKDRLVIIHRDEQGRLQETILVPIS